MKDKIINTNQPIGSTVAKEIFPINNNLLFSAIINVEAVSKANSRIALWKRRQFIKSMKAHRFCEEFAKQLKYELKYEGETITCDVAFYGILYYATLRPDLDESLILDQLQACGVIKNDRQVKEKHVWHRIDRKNPRINIKLYRATPPVNPGILSSEKY